MATYTVNPANVNPQLNLGRNLIAGEDIDAGMYIRQDGTDSKAYKALNDTAPHARVIGKAIASAKTGQSIPYAFNDAEVLDDVVTTGTLYGGAGRTLVLSSTAGKACDPADLSAGKLLTVVGYSTDKWKMRVEIVVTEIVYS